MVARSGFFGNQCTGVMKKPCSDGLKEVVGNCVSWFILFYPKKLLFGLNQSKAFQLKAGLLQAAELAVNSFQLAPYERQ